MLEPDISLKTMYIHTVCKFTLVQWIDGCYQKGPFVDLDLALANQQFGLPFVAILPLPFGSAFVIPLHPCD